MTRSDKDLVQKVITQRLAEGRWVISPSIAARALSWTVARAAKALDALYRSSNSPMRLVLSSYCDLCGAQNSTTSLGPALVKNGRTVINCAGCGDTTAVTLDNTFVEYHINSTRGDSGDGRKESAGVPSTDSRRLPGQQRDRLVYARSAER